MGVIASSWLETRLIRSAPPIVASSVPLPISYRDNCGRIPRGNRSTATAYLPQRGRQPMGTSNADSATCPFPKVFLRGSATLPRSSLREPPRTLRLTEGEAGDVIRKLHAFAFAQAVRIRQACDELPRAESIESLAGFGDVAV